MSDPIECQPQWRVPISMHFPDTGITLNRVATVPAETADDAKRRIIAGLHILRAKVVLNGEPTLQEGA